MTDIDEKLGALYRAARAQEAPSHADRVAVRTALASALIVGTGAVSAHAAASGVAATHTVKALTVGKIASWLFVGAALGGATSSAAWVLTSPPESSADHSVSAPQLPSRKAPAARSNPGAPALPAPTSAAEPASAVSPTGVTHLPGATNSAPATARERAPSPETAALSPPSLATESAGLLAIQRALGSGDAPRALKMLGEQDAEFGGGALSEERAVVRVLAWCAAGHPEQARAARDRFFSAYPHSPHAKRVQNSCAK